MRLWKDLLEVAVASYIAKRVALLRSLRTLEGSFSAVSKRILQVNMRLKGLAEIYTMHSFMAPRRAKPRPRPPGPGTLSPEDDSVHINR